MPKSKIEPEAKPNIPVSPGQEVLDDFLKRKELNKWRYIVDVITDEDCEALLILIEEHKEAEANMLLKEEMKNKPFVKAKIKEEQQTDGSCDRQTDSTSLESEDNMKRTMKCRKNLKGEFYVYTYVRNQKKILKLIEVDTAESESDKTSGKETEISDSDAHSEGQKKISSGDSIVEIETDKTEESIQELLVLREKPEEITINSDSDRNSSSPNTASIYADHVDNNKSRLSLQTVSSMLMLLSTTDGYEVDTTDHDEKQHATDLSHVPTVKLTESTGKTTEGKPFTETDPRNLSQRDFCSVTYTEESDELKDSEVESDPKSPVLDAKAEGGEQGESQTDKVDAPKSPVPDAKVDAPKSPVPDATVAAPKSPVPDAKVDAPKSPVPDAKAEGGEQGES